MDKTPYTYYTCPTREKINKYGLTEDVASKVTLFVDALLGGPHAENLHSFHVVGSALTSDFDQKASQVNSVIVLKEMDFAFVEFLAPLGNT